MLKSDFKSNAFAKILYNTSNDVICGSTLNLRHSGGNVPSHFYGFNEKNNSMWHQHKHAHAHAHGVIDMRINNSEYFNGMKSTALFYALLLLLYLLSYVEIGTAHLLLL